MYADPCQRIKGHNIYNFLISLCLVLGIKHKALSMQAITLTELHTRLSLIWENADINLYLIHTSMYTYRYMRSVKTKQM
jgi:hypothetical protein